MGRIKQENLFKNMDETTQQNAPDSDLLRLTMLVYYYYVYGNTTDVDSL